MKYYDWQKATKADGIKFRKASPNLVALNDHLVKRWGGSNVGIYSKRPVRGGDKPSSHSFGAALDWRYGSRTSGVSAVKFVIDNHEKLGVQMVIDYVGCRIWDCVGRKWRALEPNKAKGLGESWAQWFHIETTKDAWGIGKPVQDR